MVVVSSVRLRGINLACFWIDQIQLYAKADAVAIRTGEAPRIPPLYSTTIRYRPEPNAGTGIEEIADPWTVLQRGWGDCDDLIRYRIAELLLNGERATVAIADHAMGMQHAMVRRASGAQPPPGIPISRKLGTPFMLAPNGGLYECPSKIMLEKNG